MTLFVRANFEKGASFLKKILLQILIETKPGAWFDMHLLSPSHTFVFIRKEADRFSSTTSQKMDKDDKICYWYVHVEPHVTYMYMF